MVDAPHALWHLIMSYGASLPEDWETWGICLIIAGVITAMGCDIYRAVQEDDDERS